MGVKKVGRLNIFLSLFQSGFYMNETRVFSECFQMFEGVFLVFIKIFRTLFFEFPIEYCVVCV